jgi:hypothetical protein
MNQGNAAYPGYVYPQGGFQAVAPVDARKQRPYTEKDTVRHEGFQNTRYWYILSFLIHAVLSILAALFVVVATGRNIGHLPLLRTLYTSKYGDLPDTIHPTLFGYTTILRDRDVGFKPVPAIPVSFNDLPTTDDTRKDSYYRCVDGTLNYTTTFGSIAADTTRAKGICLVERYSNVATYQNHESSMTFSSSWSGAFMLTVALWISTSWQLLYVDFEKILGLRKKYIWVVWHAITFLFIILCSYLRVDDVMLPRNNVWFAGVILLFSIIQQLVIMEKYGKRDGGDPDMVYSNTNFVYSLYLKMHKMRGQNKMRKENNQEEVKEVYLTDKKLGVIVLLSDWFLVPIFFLSLFSMMSYSTLEWVFQATYVRFQLIIFGFVLLQQLRVVEEVFNKKHSMEKMVTDFEFHPRLVIFAAICLAVVNEIISMQETLTTQLDHTVTSVYAGFYIGAFCVYVALMAVLVTLPSSTTGNRSAYINLVSSLVRITFSVMLFVYLFGDYNKYACSFSKEAKQLFCGNDNKLQNLNNYDFLSPISVVSSDISTAITAVAGAVTYAPVF